MTHEMPARNLSFVADPGGLLPYSISSDGKWLVARPTPAPDLLLLATGTGRLTPLIQTQFSEVNAEISSDGRWLAYQSDSSGQPESYVRPFTDVSRGQWLVSTAGGVQPLWSRDGRELFYRALDGALMSVHVGPGTTWACEHADEAAGCAARLVCGSGRGAEQSARVRCLA
jgi:eukaryotic-like serine/threonine-protein kinase